MSILLEEATHKDIPGILELISEFYEEGLKSSGINFSKPSLFVLVKEYVEHKDACIVVAKENEKCVGVVAGFMTPSLYDRKQQIVQQKIIFVRKDYRGKIGIRLLRAIEEWAKMKGANYITMTSLEGMQDLMRFYNRNHYRKLETHYVKEV